MRFLGMMTREERSRKRKEWHQWFAWYPVTIGVQDGRTLKIWWEWVERAEEFFPSWGGDEFRWQYRISG